MLPNPTRVCDSLSRDRLGTYPGASDKESLDRYARNVRLSEALYPSLQTLEVVVRNKCETALLATFGPTWCLSPEFRRLSNPNTLSILEKAVHNVQKRKRPVTSGAVVAELTFGFWTHLFSKELETAFYVPNNRTLLPHAVRSRLVRGYVHGELRMINDLRNRVAHHEPVLTRATLFNDYERIALLMADMCPDTCQWLQVEGLDRFRGVYAWNQR